MVADNDTARYNERFLAMLPVRSWIRRVEIVREDDACLACRYMHAYVNIRELPVLPSSNCRSPRGCRCWYRPWHGGGAESP